jgi:hypothetical protein
MKQDIDAIGIEETEKFVLALESMDLKQVMLIDYVKVKAELSDLDLQEGLELSQKIIHLILDLMASLDFGAVFSVAKVLQKFNIA